MMPLTRPRAVWAVFALCLTVGVCVMAWVTTHTWRLEVSRQKAEANRDVEDRLRLALWRMDSTAGGLVFSENARTPDQFKDFHAADQLYTQAYQLVEKGLVLAPSPLLSAIPGHAQLYFQISDTGEITSPQVPDGNSRDLAEQNYTTKEAIEAAAVKLAEVRTLFPSAPDNASDGSVNRLWERSGQAGVVGGERATIAGDQSGDFPSRARSTSQSEMWSTPPSAKIQTKNPQALRQAASAGVNLDTPNVAEPFRGLWRNGELFLQRSAVLDGQRVLQSVWLKAEVIQAMLLREIGDLFPGATLLGSDEAGQAPLTVATMPDRKRSLVALPFHLEPGMGGAWVGPAWSPVRRSLAIAWTCVLLAGLAGSVLIAGILGLSERRAAFVSAVTHEMRTPLTTFRLYSEMLSRGMVNDPDKKVSYLETLTSEADRLSHLVENVLTYARLEKGSARAQVESISLQGIIERVRPRLEQRATQDGFALCVDPGEAAERVMVRVDTTAVDQILFNLVDNACKYGGREEGENVIYLEADHDGPVALLRIRDRGRGISKTEEKRLFRPFEKSATEAAHSAPGVGLGLALCRKLSRALGGDLRLCSQEQNARGACLVLSLPVIAASS